MFRPIKNKYNVFNYEKLSLLCSNPEDNTQNPLDLFLWFVLHSIKEGLLEPEEEDDYTVQNLWFLEVEKNDLENLISDCIDDFSAACENSIPIKFAGRRWSIRKPKSVDLTRLHEAFQFPEKGNMYILDPKGIMDLKYPVSSDVATRMSEAKENLKFSHQIEMLAEDDANDGWDKLTDIEAAAYCWFLYAKKREGNHITKGDLQEWYNKYKSYHGLKLSEICDCFTDLVIYSHNGVPQITYCFSKNKIEKWNNTHNQKSIVATM